MDTPEDVVRAYFAALTGSDVDGIVALFADDAVLMADGYGTANGTEEIRDTFADAFAAMTIDQELQIEAVDRKDDVAIVRASSTGTVTMLGSGDPIEVVHRELYALKRAEDGWRITDYMFNSPLAVPVEA